MYGDIFRMIWQFLFTIFVLGMASTTLARTNTVENKNNLHHMNQGKFPSYIVNNQYRKSTKNRRQKDFQNMNRNKPEKGFITDLLSNSLDILPSMIPKILQQVRGVMKQPELLPSLARTITRHIVGSNTGGDSRVYSRGKQSFRPTVGNNTKTISDSKKASYLAGFD